MPTPAHRWVRRNPIVVGFLALIIWAALVGYLEDFHSCLRTATTRRAQTHNVSVLQQMFVQDAERARRYAAVDRNLRGVAINRQYAQRRAALARSLRAPEIPGCFPLPGT